MHSNPRRKSSQICYRLEELTIAHFLTYDMPRFPKPYTFYSAKTMVIFSCFAHMVGKEKCPAQITQKVIDQFELFQRLVNLHKPVINLYKFGGRSFNGCPKTPFLKQGFRSASRSSVVYVPV